MSNTYTCSNLQSTVEAALNLSPVRGQVAVKVTEDKKIVLTGSVETFHRLQQALQAAMGVRPNDYEIVDKITVLE